MPEPKAQPLPPQREAVSSTRALVEGAAILTPLATVVSWLTTFLPIEVPASVQAAIAALVVALGTVFLSKRRDAAHAAKVAVVTLVLLVFGLGCVSYNGGAYRELATAQVVRLQGEPAERALSPQVCDALLAGAVFLRMEEGPDSSVKLPLFAGNGVEDLAQIHERQASICYELSRRDAERGVDEALRERNRAAWGSTWRSGRALLGGAH
jgi:hypothetical protein